MTYNNGKTKSTDVMTDSEKLDVLLEGLADLTTQFEDFKEDVLEKLNNFAIERSAYGIEFFDEES